MNLHRNEDGTLVDEDETFYVRKGDEWGFNQDEMIVIEHIRRNNPRGMHLSTEDALQFARQVLSKIKR